MKQKILFVAPAEGGENLGWEFITQGCVAHLTDFLCVSAFERADYFASDNLASDDKFAEFSHVVLCGNPRWDFSEPGGWLYTGLLAALREKQKKNNFVFIDAWQGAAAPLGMSLTDAAEGLSETLRNCEIADLLKELSAKIITRDVLANKVCEKFGLDFVSLPCSSARGAVTVRGAYTEPARRRQRICVVGDLYGFDGTVGIVATMALTHEIVATSRRDSQWCFDNKIPHLSVTDAQSAAVLYSRCKEVVSFRLHAAIPAAALGAEVYYCAIDSRGLTCKPFGLLFGDYRQGVKTPQRLIDSPMAHRHYHLMAQAFLLK